MLIKVNCLDAGLITAGMVMGRSKTRQCISWHQAPSPVGLLWGALRREPRVRT